MLLRRLTAALCPSLACLALLAAWGWVDGLEAGAFAAFALKGALLGLGLAVVLPAAGVGARTNGLNGWLVAGAALLGLLVGYQALMAAGRLPASPLAAAGGQTVLAECAFAAYLLAVAVGYRRR